ncbi:hypothetical protein CPB86DRAFT_590535 [Serendipita vermifera]|nr:hypothetical protein CPB86DRAFT_590535 [Serendipita vermifera]
MIRRFLQHFCCCLFSSRKSVSKVPDSTPTALADAKISSTSEHPPTPSDTEDTKTTLSPELQPSEERPAVFALLIGIDKYLDPQYRLQGAVGDAMAMENYLRTSFPSAHIRFLHDEAATRESIVREIDNLIQNPLIKPQDPILIFYAGHGGETTPPAGWTSHNGKVQMLMPQDYNEDATVITDLAFVTLLEELASKKGDNIVVILDCCYSGSMTRGSPSENDTRRERAITITGPLPDDVDQDIFERRGTRSTAVPKGFQFSGVASHVLLAACASNERAIEEGGRGVFTRVFLDTVTRMGHKNLTYSELIRHLPILPNQSPRCEGDNRDRYFFDPRPPRKDRSFYEVYMEGNDFTVRAGTVHGVNDHTMFAVFQTPDVKGLSIGFFSAQSAKATSSILQVDKSTSITLPAYAMQTRIFPIFFAEDPNLGIIREALEKDVATRAPQLERYTFVGREEASLEVNVAGDHIIFNHLYPLIHSLGLSRLPYRVRVGEEGIVRNIIQAASHFDKFMRLVSERKSLRDLVKVEVMKIKRPENRDYGPAVQDEDKEDLCKGDSMEVTAGDTLYGMKVTNNSSVQLYPHLFLFDCSDLSIESFYTPPVVDGKDKDAPLQPGGGVLTIGFGTGGEQPWSHYVRDEGNFLEGRVLQDAQDLDVSIFKLFLTVEPVELSSIKQQSPFKAGDYRAARRMHWAENDWDAISIFVSVRR